MKKIILSLAVMAIALITTSAAMADDRPVTLKQLPEKSQQFIKQHFAKSAVSYAKQDTEMFDGEYEVVFTDGVKVEFRKNGDWKNVECKKSQVPSAIVPQRLKDYVAKNHADAKIIKIEREPREFEIKLSNGQELKFNSKGDFIRYDY